MRRQTIQTIMANCKVMENGCIEWTKGFFNEGYPKISYRKKNHLGHRLVWTMLNGDIPEGMLICHKCDNKRCVNVDHLYVGTKSDNGRDAVERGLHYGASLTHCKRGHAYDEINTGRKKNGGRYCRACCRFLQNSYYQKKKIARELLAKHGGLK